MCETGVTNAVATVSCIKGAKVSDVVWQTIPLTSSSNQKAW